MKTGLTPSKCGRTAVLLVLTPMMMLNASQAVTLCVGHDGHIAIELLVGDHCTCEMRTAGANDVLISATSRLMEGRSLSCSDFVVPIGACGVRTARAASTVIPGAPAATPPLPLPAAIDALDIASLESPPAFSCHYTPLCGVILRV
jgi:hypothetical protein